jgi:hypothetical protein
VGHHQANQYTWDGGVLEGAESEKGTLKNLIKEIMTENIVNSGGGN